MLFIAPHRTAFPTARRLRREISPSRILKYRNSRFNYMGYSGLLLNWGRSDIPQTNRRVLNRPEAVRKAADKRNFLSLCEQEGVSAPRLLTEARCIEELENGGMLFIRTPNSFGGRGITVIRTLEEFGGIPTSNIAVKVYPKEAEFRAHVWKDEVISLTQKRRRRGVERSEDQKLVWSHTNDYVHCRQEVVAPHGLEELATRAVNICGLDFGAVDIIQCTDNTLKVLEVNTAPGLTGQVLNTYVEVISGIV